MPLFVSAVIKKSNTLPQRIKEMANHDKKDWEKLVSMCQNLGEIYGIFCSVVNLNASYGNKDLYIIKRVYELQHNFQKYDTTGFGGKSWDTPKFAGKVWKREELPTDPEICASLFCALLSYSVEYKRSRHLFDENMSYAEISRFRNSDVTLVNRQPKGVCRAHFETIVGQKVFKTPSVSIYFRNILSTYQSVLIFCFNFCLQGPDNLWFALVWIYAAIGNLHKGTYGNYDCKDAIEFIFGDNAL